MTGKIVIFVSKLNLRILSGLIMEHFCESCPMLVDVGWIIILHYDKYSVHLSDITHV